MLLKNGSLNFLQYSLSVPLIMSFFLESAAIWNQYHLIYLARIFFANYSAE